ncbi:hypothetical protein [Pseudalkalibacillus decolorationis]|nr:hypothetical protein [Pseudalkalibacillus decolorationis]
MRNRSGVIIMIENTVALIKRERGKEVYYVIPGGGIEFRGDTGAVCS